MPLVRLVYYSENHLDRSHGSVVAELSKILSASNLNNKPCGITGALVFDDIWFIQALEGERARVLRTFQRICCDDRHKNVMLAELCEISERTFGNWWMGLAQKTSSSAAAFQPFLVDGRLQPDKMPAGEILRLMISVAKLGLQREVKTVAA